MSAPATIDGFEGVSAAPNPSAIAKPPATLPLEKPWDGPQWEYRTRRIETLKVPDAELERKLNDLGRHGWEIMAVQTWSTGLRVFCKRPARTGKPGKVAA